MVETGQMIGARAQLKWRMVVPTRTRIAGELLEWQQGEVIYGYDTAEPYRFKITQVDGPRCLEDFAALAGKKPPQFAAFARRFGPLLAVNAASEERIWRHRSVIWPVFDAQELPARRDAGALWRREPLAQWREWAEYVQFVLNIAKMLRERSRAGQEGIPFDFLRGHGAEPRPPRADRLLRAGATSGRFALAENLAHGAMPGSGVPYPRGVPQPTPLDLQWRILLAQVTQDFLAAPCVRQSFAPTVTGTLKASRLSLERDAGDSNPDGEPLPAGVFPLIAASLADALTNPGHLHVCMDCQQHYPVERARANGRCEACRKAERARKARERRENERAANATRSSALAND